ncbi:hypothetical protein EMCRGX_G032983 [Ephydatia muelleri]
MTSSDQPLSSEPLSGENPEDAATIDTFQTIARQLRSCNVKFLRVAWCDTANVIRAKAAYVPRLEGVFKDGVALCVGNQALPVMYDAVTAGSGLGPLGDLRLMPDWDTLRILPYASGHASVMSNMYTNEGQPSNLCPRNFLRRMIAEASASGVCLKAAFENEFYLLRQPSNGADLVPVDDTTFCMTYAMDINHDVITDICHSLTAQGIVLEQYHAESGNGQHEISIVYSDAMKAADQQIVFRETVKAVAHKHQMVACFLPKIFPNQAGSGTHIHLSLHTRDGTNLVPSETENGSLSPVASHFVAGVLEHLPGLMAITAPTPNSYRRLQPSTWSGAYKAWGYENKECALRRVPLNPRGPSPTHFELKTNDATANPYFALGAILAAGLDGVHRKLPLSPPLQIDPGQLSDDERFERNIQRLPTCLEESLGALSSDMVLLEALSPALSQAYLAVKHAEWKAMNKLTLDEEVKLLVNRY